MPKPIELNVLALAPFAAGEIGWLTEKGVVRAADSGFADLGPLALPVRAVEVVGAHTRGRFIEILPFSPDPDRATGPTSSDLG